jgi:translocation and assembly module TamA
MGGAGSVRAFGFQKAGPVDAAGDPTGGVSALGLGGELRFRASDTIGVVPFVEGGRAYASRLPDLSQTLFWGGGIGLRYITPIGPVRADVAVPVNRRSGVDDPFQIYLSLGQAF